MSNLDQYNQLVNSIYDSVFNPSGLDLCMKELFSSFNAVVGGYFIQNKRNLSSRQVSMYGYDDNAVATYNNYYCTINPWFTNKPVRQNLVVTEMDLDLFHNQSKYYYQTEFFNDFSKPNGLGSYIGVALSSNGQDYLNFLMGRPLDADFYSKEDNFLLDQLKPHLLRAVEMREVIDAAHSYGSLLLDSFDIMNIGLMLLNQRGSIIELNKTANRIINANDGLSIKSKRIRCHLEQSQKLLDNLISSGCSSQNIRVKEPINIPRLSSSPPYQIQVIQTNNRPLSSFIETGVISMLIIQDPKFKTEIPRDSIRSYFNLTERETDIAELLLSGLKAKNIASKLGLSYESTRWYIKQIYIKTNTSSQNELIIKLISTFPTNIIDSSDDK